jgi:hypothetical protein
VIAIVSGLPRSGTSLMMQMLAAGGMPVLSDGERTADADNPRGYLEWERIKLLPQQPGCIREAEGKAVKVISQLLFALPSSHEYRIIFIERPLAEVVASQAEMIRRRGTSGPKLAEGALLAALQGHLNQVNSWLKNKSATGVAVHRVQYHGVLTGAHPICESVQDFLGLRLNLEAMAAQVDSSLYRQRFVS